VCCGDHLLDEPIKRDGEWLLVSYLCINQFIMSIAICGFLGDNDYNLRYEGYVLQYL
jgi:hypothetical protein